MKKLILTTLCLLVVRGVQADQGRVPVYVVVDCIKTEQPDFAVQVREVWLPLYQERVRRGQMKAWALYSIQFGDRSRCDYYAVESYTGADGLDSKPGPGPGVAAAAVRRVFSELWLLVDSTEIRPHRYAIVNLMRAADPVAYERMESQVFKAGHEVLLDNGHRSGWSVYELISPLGSSVPYNYSTVDFVDHLGPVPMAEAMLEAHPDRDIEVMHGLLRLREQVRSETWALVVATAPATD